MQPFLTTLGYDIGNPDEVSPEHHADFSDKYQNKVDFAILHQGVPVITLESKRVGNAKKDDLGQLRSYFNALQTVKLGILTDGLKYDFYADSDKPNMMDDHAFLRVDFADIDRNGTIDDNTLSGIAAIRRGSFNPEDVGAEAKRKLLFESIVNTIKEFKVAPSDDFIRKDRQNHTENRRREPRGCAIGDGSICRSGGTRPFWLHPEGRRADDPRTPRARRYGCPSRGARTGDRRVRANGGRAKCLGICEKSLFYLVQNDTLFHEVQKIEFRKTKTSFRVFYGKPNIRRVSVQHTRLIVQDTRMITGSRGYLTQLLVDRREIAPIPFSHAERPCLQLLYAWRRLIGERIAKRSSWRHRCPFHRICPLGGAKLTSS